MNQSLWLSVGCKRCTFRRGSSAQARDGRAALAGVFQEGNNQDMLPTRGGGQQLPSPHPGTAKASLTTASPVGFPTAIAFPSPLQPELSVGPLDKTLLGCTALLAACSQPGSSSHSRAPPVAPFMPLPGRVALLFPPESSQRGFSCHSSKTPPGNTRSPETQRHHGTPKPPHLELSQESPEPPWTWHRTVPPPWHRAAINQCDSCRFQTASCKNNPSFATATKATR